MSFENIDVRIRATARGVQDLEQMQEIHKLFSEYAELKSVSVYGLLHDVEEGVSAHESYDTVLADWLDAVESGEQQFFADLEMPHSVFVKSGFTKEIEELRKKYPNITFEECGCVYPDLKYTAGVAKLVFEDDGKHDYLHERIESAIREWFGSKCRVKLRREGNLLFVEVAGAKWAIDEEEADDYIYDLYINYDIRLKSFSYESAVSFNADTDSVTPNNDDKIAGKSGAELLLIKAGSDLGVAHFAMQQKDWPYDHQAAFHVEQAIEKTLRAYLMSIGKDCSGITRVGALLSNIPGNSGVFDLSDAEFLMRRDNMLSVWRDSVPYSDAFGRASSELSVCFSFAKSLYNKVELWVNKQSISFMKLQ